MVSEGGEAVGGSTIRASGERFNPEVPKNIEGSSPRTKISYGAAATTVDEGVGFIKGFSPITKTSYGAAATKVNDGVGVIPGKINSQRISQ